MDISGVKRQESTELQEKKERKAMLINIRNNSRQGKKEMPEKNDSAEQELERMRKREESERAWKEMQEMLRATIQEKPVRIQELVSF